MKEKELLYSIKRSINEAPIDILQNIKDAPRTKLIRHDQITRQKTKGNAIKKLMPYASIAAAFLVVFFGWQYQTKISDSYIYMDVNPSIKITSNRLDKVIDIKAENIDGRLLTKDLNYKNKTIAQVAGEVLDRMIYEKYLDENHKYLLVSVYNKNKEKAKSQKLELDRKIHEHLKEKELEPIVLSQKLENTSTIESLAKEYGISVSKMTFIRNLILLNSQLKTEELVDLSIKELVELSQGIGLDLNKIIDSTDFHIIENSEVEKKEDLENPQMKPLEPIYPEDDEDDDDDDDEDRDDDDEKANNKPIDKAEKNRITSEKAKKIAIRKVGGGRITEFESDDEEYEIEIKYNGKEYEIEIDAYSGEIIEFEVKEDEDDEEDEKNKLRYKN